MKALTSFHSSKYGKYGKYGKREVLTSFHSFGGTRAAVSTASIRVTSCYATLLTLGDESGGVLPHDGSASRASKRKKNRQKKKRGKQQKRTPDAAASAAPAAKTPIVVEGEPAGPASDADPVVADDEKLVVVELMRWLQLKRDSLALHLALAQPACAGRTRADASASAGVAHVDALLESLSELFSSPLPSVRLSMVCAWERIALELCLLLLPLTLQRWPLF